MVFKVAITFGRRIRQPRKSGQIFVTGVQGLPSQPWMQRHGHNVDGSGADRFLKPTGALLPGRARHQASLAWRHPTAAGPPAMLHSDRTSGAIPFLPPSVIPASSAESKEALKMLVAASSLGVGGAVLVTLGLAPDSQEADRPVPSEASKTPAAVAMPKNIQLRDHSAAAKAKAYLITDWCHQDTCAFYKLPPTLYSDDVVILTAAIGADMLLVTKKHLPSFAALAASYPSLKMTPMLEAIRAHGEKLGLKVIVAEHGAASAEKKSCQCVDHAHQHIVGLSSDEEVEKVQQFFLSHAGSPDLVLASFDELRHEDLQGKVYNMLSIREGEVQVWFDEKKLAHLPTQFFQRAVNEARGRPPQEYNWRDYPRLEDIPRIMEKFGHVGEVIKEASESKVQSAAVYMDTPATTPVDSRVLEKMAEIRGNFGNPSSSNLHGTGARQLVDASRSSIAQAAGAKPEEVIFTSGATEGANAVFYALGEQFRGDQPHQIVSAVEHKAILHPAQRLEEHGWQKTLLPVNADGLVADVAKYLTASTRAVFIQMVNNETGVRQPVEEIAKVIKRYNPDIFVIVDAAQAFGKCPINFDDSEVDAMLTSGHKIHAPKGVGALIAKPRVKALLKQHPLLLGGGQEGGMRAGTENVDGIVGFGVAARLAAEEHTSRSEHVNRLSKNLVKGIQAEHPEVKINGSKTSRLPNIISLRIPRVDAGALNMELGKSLSYSTSSACNGGVGQSHVLKAMGVDLTQNAVMRLGISYMTTEADIEETIRQVNAALAKMKQH